MPINPPRKYSAAERAVGSVRSLDPYSLIIGWVLCGLTIAFLALVTGVR